MSSKLLLWSIDERETKREFVTEFSEFDPTNKSTEKFDGKICRI